MAGTLISVVSKTTYTMTFSSGASQSIALSQKPIDVRDAVSGVLVVRVSSWSPGTGSFPAGGTFTVGVSNAIIMPDDPSTIYSIPSSPLVTVTINPNTDGGTGIPPRLYLASFTVSSSPPCGPMVGLGLWNTYGTGSGSGSITMGVELLIRDSG
jgi:hypothetical protein